MNRCTKFCELLSPIYGGTLANIIVDMHDIPQRAYHNLCHIEHCLSVFDTIPDDMDNLGEASRVVLEAAIWLHDAVYVPGERTNEDASIALAAILLRGVGVTETFVGAVEECIDATKHLALPAHHYTPTAMYMMDIDLSGFGEGMQVVRVNNANIAKEYPLSHLEYVRERNKFLETLLKRKRLFYTDYFFEKLEEAAKQNISELIREP